MLLYPIGTTKANEFAAEFLKQAGVPLIDHPSAEVTHVLTDIPGFRSNVEEILLPRLPEAVFLFSGKIPERFSRYPQYDLLTDEDYLWKNAAITAECALRLSPQIHQGSRVLIVGWGRIGKHLARLLDACSCEVTVYSRSPAHRAEIASFGLRTALSSDYDTIFNTAPGSVLPSRFKSRAFQIDLASQRGLPEDALWARGLPGIHAPRQSGRLIADTVLRRLKEAGK